MATRHAGNACSAGRQPLDDRHADWKADAEFEGEPCICLTVFVRSLISDSRTLCRADILLRLRLGRYEPHGRARGRFADCLGIDIIILVALDEGAHVPPLDEFDLMPEGGELASHVVRASASFHDYGASMKGGKKLKPVPCETRLCRAVPDREG